MKGNQLQRHRRPSKLTVHWARGHGLAAELATSSCLLSSPLSSGHPADRAAGRPQLWPQQSLPAGCAIPSPPSFHWLSNPDTSGVEATNRNKIWFYDLPLLAAVRSGWKTEPSVWRESNVSLSAVLLFHPALCWFLDFLVNTITGCFTFFLIKCFSFFDLPWSDWRPGGCRVHLLTALGQPLDTSPTSLNCHLRLRSKISNLNAHNSEVQYLTHKCLLKTRICKLLQFNGTQTKHQRTPKLCFRPGGQAIKIWVTFTFAFALSLSHPDGS